MMVIVTWFAIAFHMVLQVSTFFMLYFYLREQHAFRMGWPVLMAMGAIVMRRALSLTSRLEVTTVVTRTDLYEALTLCGISACMLIGFYRLYSEAVRRRAAVTKAVCAMQAEGGIAK